MDRSHELCRLMFSIKGHLDTLLFTVSSSCQVTPLQMAILLHLRRNPSSLKELRCQLHLNQGNASTICKKMETEGWLRRVRDAHDERLVQLVLTPAGQTLAADLDCRLEQLSQLLEAYPEAQMEPIVRGMEQASSVLLQLTAALQTQTQNQVN